MRNLLDSQEFHELMLCYRYADRKDQKQVCERFEAVKNFILSHTENEGETDEFDNLPVDELDGMSYNDFWQG